MYDQYPAALKLVPAGAASPMKVLSPTSALAPPPSKPVTPLSPGKAAESSLLSAAAAAAAAGMTPKLLAPPKGPENASESLNIVNQESNGTGKSLT